jgi:hypothetical protein
MRGYMNQFRILDPEAFERMNYMRILHAYETT